jgi:hypothetical protein
MLKDRLSCRVIHTVWFPLYGHQLDVIGNFSGAVYLCSLAVRVLPYVEVGMLCDIEAAPGSDVHMQVLV